MNPSIRSGIKFAFQGRLLTTVSRMLVAVIVASHVLSARTDLENESTPCDRSRAIAERVLHFAKRKKLEPLMKLVDTPWGNDGSKVIERREDLERFFQKTLEEESLAEVEWKIGKVVSVAEYRKSGEPKELEVLDQVLTPADRIVRVVADGEKVVLYVRLCKKQARLVGYHYPL